jgi:hypothetical protein
MSLQLLAISEISVIWGWQERSYKITISPRMKQTSGLRIDI